MKANCNFPIAVIIATVLFFVWCQPAASETPVQKQIGELARVHPECELIVEELLSSVENYAPMPQAGQESCWDEYGAPLGDCEGTGQDGEFQMGVDWSADGRFTENSPGTVTDTLTGLIWLKKTNCIGTNDPLFDTDGEPGDGRVTWQHALDFVAGINAEAYADGGA